jgi:lysozyme family protein
MADFAPAYQKTNAREGMVFSDVPSDRGGMTYGGIARQRQPGGSWRGWELIDRVLARGAGRFAPTPQESAALAEQHQAFFRQYFWDDLNASLVPDQGIAEKLYDAAVNCSRLRAVGWVQAALNVSNLRGRLWPDIVIDGQLGPQTANVIGAAARDPLRRWLVLQVLETQQEQHYFELASRDPSQEMNLLGWYRHRILHRVEPPRA